MANVWADVRKSSQLQPDEVPPMPSVWATPDTHPESFATPVADVRGPEMQLSPDTEARGNLPQIAQRQLLAHDINEHAKYAQAKTPFRELDTAHKIGRVFSTLGNVAGNIVAPNVMANIPGTEMYGREREREFAHRLDTDVQHEAENKEKEAQGRYLGAEAGTKEAQLPYVPEMEQATIRHLGAESTALENPEQYHEVPGVLTHEGQPVEYSGKTGEYKAGDIPGGVVPALSRMGMQAKPGIYQGKNAYADFNPRTGEYTNPDTHEPMPGFVPFPPFSQVPNIQPYPIYIPQTGNFGIGGFNTKSGNVTMPQPGSPQPVPQNVFGELNKNLEDARGADTRFRVMSDSVKPALAGDQQAMLNILTNHIGMTLGLQKGARITQAIYSEAEQSSPLLQRLAARFDDRGYLTGVALTPEQINSMVALGQDRRMRQWQQYQDAAKNYGLDVHVPADLQNPTTVLSQPGGQANNGAPPAGANVVKWADIGKH